jgi:hypothetical protein
MTKKNNNNKPKPIITRQMVKLLITFRNEDQESKSLYLCNPEHTVQQMLQ